MGLDGALGFMESKKVLAAGAPDLCMALDIGGKRLALVSSHWPWLSRNTQQ